MTRSPTTLEQRIATLLNTFSSLTSGQMIQALAPADHTVVYTTVYRLSKRRRLSRVEQSAAQRHQTGGTGYAYALEAR